MKRKEKQRETDMSYDLSNNRWVQLLLSFYPNNYHVFVSMHFSMLPAYYPPLLHQIQ